MIRFEELQVGQVVAIAATAKCPRERILRVHNVGPSLVTLLDEEANDKPTTMTPSTWKNYRSRTKIVGGPGYELDMEGLHQKMDRVMRALGIDDGPAADEDGGSDYA